MNRHLAPIFCSIALGIAQSSSGALLCRDIFALEQRTPFEVSHQYIEKNLPQYINGRAGKARVDGSFLAAFHVQNGEMYSLRQEPLDLVLGSFALTVTRGDIAQEALPPLIGYSANIPIEASSHGRWMMGFEPVSEAVRKVDASLKTVYESFAAQGQERQSLVPIIERQDRVEVDRVTHFTLSNGRPFATLGHAQILTSRSSSQPLHVEQQWGALQRKPGEVIGEVGRLVFLPKEAVPRGASEWLSGDKRTLTRLSLFQKMLSWANHDVGFDRLFFQVNAAVAAVLQRSGIPLDQANRREVVGRYEGKEVKEYIFEMDRQFLLKAEEVVMAKVLELHLQAFLAARESGGGKLVMRYSRNEIAPLLRMGIIAEVAGHPSFGRHGLSASDFKSTLSAQDYLATLLSPRILRALSNDFVAPAEHSAAFYEAHRVSFAAFTDLPALPATRSRVDDSRPLFPVAPGDLSGRDFLELHFSRNSVEFLLEKLQSHAL